MDAHRKRHLDQNYLTWCNKRKGAYGCCLDLIASQNTSEIAKLRIYRPKGIWGVSVTDNSVVSSGFNTVVEQQATSVPGPTWNGSQMPTLKKSYNRYTSFPVYKDTSAFMGANPAEEAYFQVWARAKNEATNNPAQAFLVCITYNVTCYELKDLGSS